MFSFVYFSDMKNEEIEKKAFEKFPLKVNGVYSAENNSKRNVFISACEWYSEELKKEIDQEFDQRCKVFGIGRTPQETNFLQSLR